MYVLPSSLTRTGDGEGAVRESHWRAQADGVNEHPDNMATTALRAQEGSKTGELSGQSKGEQFRGGERGPWEVGKNLSGAPPVRAVPEVRLTRLLDMRS